MLQVQIPQIDVPQGRPTMANKDFMFTLQPSPFFGRHNLRFMDFAARHDFLNKLLQDVYIIHNIGKVAWEKDTFYSLDGTHFTHKLNIETIIYWLRKTADEIISLVYFVNYVSKHKEEPQKIEIDCIGRLLNDKGETNALLCNQLNYLTVLNDIANAFKHSFLNFEANTYIGVDEPTVIAFQMKNNDSRTQPIVHNHYLKDIVNSYTLFFKEATDVLQKINPHW